MIQAMRKNAATIMWVVIIAFVATIVFAWGMDLSSQSRTKNVVGKINGKDIAINYFERMVESERQREHERTGSGDIPAYQSRMIPRQVWETEINRILLKEVFSKMQLSASSDQLFNYIKKNPPQEVYKIPQFQTDSVFDTTKFIQFLNDPRAYENDGMRQLEQHTKDMAIPMQTLQALVTVQGEPNNAELAYEYRTATEKAAFEYAKMSPTGFTVDSSEIKEPGINAYYASHADSFTSEEQADLYFVKFPKVATANDYNIIRNDLNELRNKIGNNDSIFQEEAKVESDDEGSSKNGGDLGWISRGAMVPQFDSAVFSIPVGVVSQPIQTQFGFHLILVEKRELKNPKDPKDKTVQAKVRHLLRKIAPSGETLDKLNAQADSLQKAIAADGIKTAVKKESGVQIDSTGLFKRGDVVPKTGFLSGVGSFAFNHEADEVSDILENEEGYFVFQVKARLKKGLQPLAFVREKIVQKLSDSLRMEKAMKRFEEDIKKMTDKSDLLGLMKIDPLIIAGKTDTVTRAKYIPQVGVGNQAVAAAFALKPGAVSNIIKTKEALFLVKPLWQQKVDNIPWTSSEMLALRKKIESETVQKVYYDWYLDYRNRAKIIDNLNQYYMD
jgi:peptidyl-prolyl cis-trans isomerase D